MGRYAVLRDGIIENVVAWNGADPWEPPSGTEVVPIGDDDLAIIGELLIQGDSSVH